MGQDYTICDHIQDCEAMNHTVLPLIIKEQRRLLILFAILSGCCLLLWLYLLGPRHKELQERQAEWTAKRRHVPQKVSGSASDRTTLDKLWASLPERNELPRILGQLYDIAGTSEVSITALSYKPLGSSADGLIAYTLKCSARGRYDALKRFVAQVQHLSVTATVDTISLTSKDPFAEMVTLETQISLHLRDGTAP